METEKFTDVLLEEFSGGRSGGHVRPELGDRGAVGCVPLVVAAGPG